MRRYVPIIVIALFGAALVVTRAAEPFEIKLLDLQSRLLGAFSLLSALPDISIGVKEIGVALKADASKDVFVNRQATEKNVKLDWRTGA